MTKPSTPVAQARLSATHPSAGRQRRTSAEYQKLPGRPQRIPGIFPGWKEDRTTADVLSKLTWNKELIGVLAAQWGNYGLPPQQSSFAVHATIAHHYFEGASYPVGGASRIAETIAPVIERSGGKIVVNAEVSAILVKQGRAVGVRMADSREIRAGTIICDTGAPSTFADLLREETGSLERPRANLRRIPPSTAHLCLYVGSQAVPRPVRHFRH